MKPSYDTAPYFHDGSMSSLRALIAFKTGEGVHADPERSELFEGIEPLSTNEIEDLVGFLDALRGAPLEDMGPPAAFP